ncbi:hypothetical protein LCGC14_1867880, partial [marine sediment metagenome]
SEGSNLPESVAAHTSASSLSPKEESDGQSDGARIREGLPEGETRGDTATESWADIPVGDDSGSASGSRRSQRQPSDIPLTHEQRVAIAKEIRDAQLRRQFPAGDTANQWDEELGEDFWNLYANEFGYTYPSLRNVMRVCKNIPPDKRNPEASFALHDVVDGFDFETQEAWLERAVTEEWTVKRLREELVAEGLLGTKPKVKR